MTEMSSFTSFTSTTGPSGPGVPWADSAAAALTGAPPKRVSSIRAAISSPKTRTFMVCFIFFYLL